MSSRRYFRHHLRRERSDDKEPKLSTEETEQVKAVFTLFDKDGDNTMELKHLGTVMRALGQYPTEEDLEKIKEDMSADGSEVVRFQDMCDLMARRPWGFQGSEEELRTAFQVFDKHDNGSLSAGELRHALTTLGERLTDEELSLMMKKYPTDGDGFVGYEDFIKELME